MCLMLLIKLLLITKEIHILKKLKFSNTFNSHELKSLGLISLISKTQENFFKANEFCR